MNKFILKYKYYWLSLLIIVILVLFIYFFLFKKVDNENSVFNDVTFIGHALYGIDKRDYSNSVESLELGYDKGIRVMEADFLFTTDGDLILNHYWEDTYREKTNSFMNKKIYDKYRPMDLNLLLEYMEKYPDLYIVIDTKEDEYNFGNTVLDVYKKIVDVTKSYNEDLLDRFIVQIYNCDDYERIVDIYDFKHKIVSIYKMYPYNLYDVIYFCLKYNVEVFALPIWYLENGTVTEEEIKLIKSKNIKVFVHTINDEDVYNNLLNIGVDGVYTDFLN